MNPAMGLRRAVVFAAVAFALLSGASGADTKENLTKEEKRMRCGARQTPPDGWFLNPKP